ncbi:tRNA threonylcarbamoyladenosine dehydratase isoform X4 [Phalaenopsis equestris]|uniref:tRNA threonylcarbamoyladenosine dehydratase isoform X4 n=1 Tax=Phalaenopsis equestris TaxID=78828 RepID=UPI0009E1CE7E|nr:tRNA threonylcarbamoyladenosine dehydratase isoform X4 [Phalaenopsis equestris]
MSDRRIQWCLIGTSALLGSLCTIAALNLFSRWSTKMKNKRTSTLVNLLEESNASSGPDALFGISGMRCSGVLNNLSGKELLKDEVVSEQLTRNIQFFGMNSQQRVAESYVVIVGLGGVGSHAASMLLRSGVGRLLLVDFDQVSLSSLNRHAVATRADVGIPKAICLQKHFSSIFPECRVEAKVQLYDESSEEEILSGKPDFVLDCIDNIDTKVALLSACVRRSLKVLSAMGAGARADPTRIRVADLGESSIDPLSRAVRYRLRKDHGIEGGIPVVFSVEKPKVKLLPFKGSSGEEENPSDYQLAELPVHTEPVVNLDLNHYRILHQRLLEHEELLYGSAEVLVGVEEVCYIVKELWHGRSARDQSSRDVGRKMWRSVNELMLVRWNREQPASVSNLILLKFEEADAHETTTIENIKEQEPEFHDMVTAVLKRAMVDFML